MCAIKMLVSSTNLFAYPRGSFIFRVFHVFVDEPREKATRASYSHRRWQQERVLEEGENRFSLSSFEFHMRLRRSPGARDRATRFRQPDRYALTGRIIWD